MQSAQMASKSQDNSGHPSNSGVRRGKEESVHRPGQNAAVLCRIYHCSLKCHSARPAEEERRKSNFLPMLTCSSRKLCINVLSIFDDKSIQ